MTSAQLSVCFVFASGGIGGAERSMLRLMQCVHPKRLNCRVLLMTKENAEFEDSLSSLGIPFQRNGRVGVLALWKSLRTDTPDIVYLFGNIRTLLWAIIARLAGIKTIIIAERSIPASWITRFGRRTERFVVDAFISNSEAAASILRQKCGVSSSTVHVVYNGIETSAPKPIAGATEIDVVCVANIRKLKGHVILLQAIKQLQEQYFSLKCVLFGEDLTEGEFFERAVRDGLGGTYDWRGFSARASDYLSVAKVFVLPSLEREGTPTSILEAMNAGAAVVASDVGGVSELIEDQVTGLLVEPGNSEMLAEKIGLLLSSPALRHTLATNAQAHVAEYHSIESMVERHLYLFSLLTKGDTVSLRASQ